MTAPLGGAVLTGGTSSRAGIDKALAVLDGVPLAGRVAAVLGQAGADPVVAIGGDGDRLRAAGLDWVADRWPGDGPLGGLVTALGALPNDVVVVTACDLPWLEPGLVESLAHAAEGTGRVAVPVVAGRRQWHLVAVPRGRGRAVAEAFDAGGRSLREGLEPAGLHDVEVAASHAGALADLDTREQLARAGILLRPSGDDPHR